MCESAVPLLGLAVAGQCPVVLGGAATFPPPGHADIARARHRAFFLHVSPCHLPACNAVCGCGCE